MAVAVAISAVFLSLAVFLVCLIQVDALAAFTYYGKVAQGRTAKSPTLLAKIVNALVRITVPKSWFAHFYVLYSVLMWSQLLLMYNVILENNKYSLVWALLTCQATRRLYESYFVTRWSSASNMHISHYLVGLLFYVGVSGACFLGLRNQEMGDNEGFFQLRTLFVVVPFCLFQWDQHRNHTHLASLVKYSVPSRGLFSVVSSAHYLDEIAIYFVVVVSVFSQGQIIVEDWAFLCIWIFAVTNLSISAVETHRYYEAKFDDFKVKHAILPGIL